MDLAIFSNFSHLKPFNFSIAITVFFFLAPPTSKIMKKNKQKKWTYQQMHVDYLLGCRYCCKAFSQCIIFCKKKHTSTKKKKNAVCACLEAMYPTCPPPTPPLSNLARGLHSISLSHCNKKRMNHITKIFVFVQDVVLYEGRLFGANPNEECFVLAEVCAALPECQSRKILFSSSKSRHP